MQIKTTMSYPLTPLEQPLFKKKNKQKISAGKDVEKVPPLGTVSRIMKWYSESHSVMSNSLWPRGYTVHGILQTRILEWVVFPFSRGSSQPRDWTQVSHIAGRFFTSWATREAHEMV